jgi:prepilin-type N-terminal cleavage/methylation domain-containing protein
MNAKRGFTLVELLAVIAIMLVLMVATFGTFSIFAERAGPDAVLGTIQSYINTARDYATSQGVSARVYFTADPAKPMDGTSIIIQYLPAGMTDWSLSANQALDLPGMKPMALQDGMYVLKDIGTAIYAGTLAPPAQTGSGSTIPTQADIQKATKYDQDLRANLKTYALDASGKIQPMHQKFFIEVDPSGYLALNNGGNSGAPGTNLPVTNGLVVVKLAPAGDVVGYSFYPLNASTGTRLIFE